jgi:hypothetical protein
MAAMIPRMIPDQVQEREDVAKACQKTHHVWFEKRPQNDTEIKKSYHVFKQQPTKTVVYQQDCLLDSFSHNYPWFPKFERNLIGTVDSLLIIFLQVD